MAKNESALRPMAEVKQRLLEIYGVMASCITRGCKQTGVLPGSLRVKRRAPSLYQQRQNTTTCTDNMSRLNLYAIAVNEENAAGGRIVTRPHQRRRWHYPGGLNLLFRRISRLH